jgi:hypothetical protein
MGQVILKSYPCLFLVELKLHARMTQLRRGEAGDNDDLLETENSQCVNEEEKRREKNRREEEMKGKSKGKEKDKRENNRDKRNVTKVIGSIFQY